MLQQKDINKILENLLPTKDERRAFEECQNALERLNILVHNFHLKYPFQNLTLLAKDIKADKVPTLEEVKQNGLNFKGGLCYTNNIFFCLFLKGLGFQAHHIVGNCNHPNNHIAILVQNVVENADQYFIDVGCGYPTYQAIALNFMDESPVYQSGFLQYKFTNKGDGVYERQNLRNFSKDGTIFENVPTWATYYDFPTIPQEIEDFRPGMPKHFNGFLKKFRIQKFTDTSMSTLKEEGLDLVLLTLSREGRTTKKVIKPVKLVCTIQNMFPSFSKKDIDSAYQHWCYFRKYKVSQL